MCCACITCWTQTLLLTLLAINLALTTGHMGHIPAAATYVLCMYHLLDMHHFA
jgi:hypothetical protein